MFQFLRNKMKAILITVAVIFAATMFYGLGYIGLNSGNIGGGTATNQGLAKVNGSDVDIFRFNQMLNRLVSQSKGSVDPMSMLYIQNMALSQLIDFSIMAREAGRHFGVSGAEINKAVSDIMAANNIPDERTFNQALKNQGFSLDNLRRMIKDEILVQKMVSKVKGDAAVSPDDLREVSARHILISVPDAKKDNDAKKLAEEVLAKAKSGQDFGDLAKKYSNDPGSAAKKGDLGFFKKGAMVKEFDDAVFALKPGEMSGLVKTMFGYHIIKMNESRARKDANRDKILEEKRERVFNTWFSGLKQKAKIEIKNHLLNAFDMRMKGNNSGAIEEYKKAIKAQQDSPYPHLFYADMLNQSGNGPAAMEEYAKASNIAGSDPYAHLYVGKSYMNASDTAKGATEEAYLNTARSEFMRASILAGEDKKIRQDLAKFFKELKLTKMLREENAKIAQLEVKEKFEESIRKAATEATMEAGKK